MDSFVIKTIGHEINKSLCPVKITHIELVNHSTLILRTYKERQHKYIIVCVNPDFPHCYMANIQPKIDSAHPTPFLIILRKYLIGSKIETIYALPMERILIFNIIPFEAGHKGDPLKLIVELMGKPPNIVLIDHASREILGCFRSHPQETYHFPGRPKEKLNPLEINYETFTSRISGSSKGKWSADLVAILFGINPTVADEIIHRARIADEKPPAGHSLQEPIGKIWDALQELLDFYRDPTITKAVYMVPHNPQHQPLLSVFPLTLKEGKGTSYSFSDINQAAEAFYALIREADECAKEKKQLYRHIKSAKKRFKRRLLNLMDDQKNALNADEYRRMGDILMANLNQIHKGMEEILLPDLYHHQEGAQIRIKLDPKLPPVKNAHAFYRLYQKAKRAIHIIQQRINETESSLALLDTAEKNLLSAQDRIELFNMAEELKNTGVPAPKRNGDETKQEGKKSHKPLPGIRYFVIEDTWNVLVGKNNNANDYLTRRMARSEDFWFHAYNTPGSHVILRNPHKEKTIPPSILQKTAAVAAFFSRQRKADKALVGYTQRKYIRKAKGLKPGMVLVDYQQTITVAPSLKDVVPL
ncbi:MAG: NFACT family protein [bacterium]